MRSPVRPVIQDLAPLFFCVSVEFNRDRIEVTGRFWFELKVTHRVL
ncbi:uncharacterized protein METZ01_LOCUS159762, partial [marine metagenome]